MSRSSNRQSSSDLDTPSSYPPPRIAEANNRVGTPVGSPRILPGFNIHRPIIEQEDDSVMSTDESPFSTTSNLIDNSILVYIPVKLRCGVICQCRPDVLARCPSVLRDLNNDVQGCLDVLPPSVHSLVKRTTIWCNCTYYYGPREQPRNVNHSTAHHHEGWLYWARDKPEKAGGIEIYNCFDYQAMRLHWNGSGLLLHELCHLLHQFTLPNGLDNTNVIEAFQTATQSGLYDQTLRRDWAGMDCEHDMAYCMVNHKEFFSEMSVTYLAGGYAHLDSEDHSLMDKCSPPLMAPGVVQRVKLKRSSVLPLPIDGVSIAEPNESRLPLLEQPARSSGEETTKTTLATGFWKLFTRRKSEKPKVSHCNKFYPFTKGQLQNHDPELFVVFEELWTQIASWDDEDADDAGPCARLRKCWPK